MENSFSGSPYLDSDCHEDEFTLNLDTLDSDFKIQNVRKIAFSLGVSFVESPSMEKLMKQYSLVVKIQTKKWKRSI